MPITAEILIFAWLLQQQPLYNLKQKMMKRFILSLAIRLPVIAGCEKTVAGTTDPEDGPGTFTIEATPSTTSVSLKVTPSGNEKPYLILGSASTLCAIGIDADGNPGEMHMTLTTFPEEGKSTDYELFDKYYNQLTGYSMSSVITPRHAGICRPVQFPR